MKRIALLLLLLAGALNAAPRFVALDVYIDAPDPIAAWQFELSAENSSMSVVGVENGDSDTFHDAPYYDREAVQSGRADRIVIADYSVADVLPSGRIRIATVHVMLDGGEPEFNLRLITATTRDGNRLDASITLEVQGADHDRT